MQNLNKLPGTNCSSVLSKGVLAGYHFILLTSYVKANVIFSVLIALSYSLVALFGVITVAVRYWRGSESVYGHVSDFK